MATESTRGTRLSLAEVQAHFRSWRQMRKKGARIPAQLWEEAR